MMNYYELIKAWYDAREMREKLWVLALGASLIYALFTFFLLHPLANAKFTLTDTNQALKTNIDKLNDQISALKQIPNTALYKEWLAQRKELVNLNAAYNAYLKESPTKQWSTVIKTILASHPNVTLAEIKNLPEVPYKPVDENATHKHLYQQQLTVTVFSNYNETISYLEHLEKSLPHIHWTKLNYNVASYPIAKVEMEFSIIYEKTAS